MGIIAFCSLPSTNSYAKEHLSSLNHNDIVTALIQTEGRARNKRKWHSARGGLYFSLILKPSFAPPDLVAAFTHVMALSVCKAVKQKGARAYIKWPNDILSGGKKLCGILSEAVFENDFLKGIIVGVGLNISQAQIISDKPAVTLNGLGIDTRADIVLAEIINNFNILYNRLIQDGYKSVKAQYKANFPYLGKEVTVKAGVKEIKGTALDIDDLGRLIIKNANGALETVSAGDMDF